MAGLLPKDLQPNSAVYGFEVTWYNPDTVDPNLTYFDVYYKKSADTEWILFKTLNYVFDMFGPYYALIPGAAFVDYDIKVCGRDNLATPNEECDTVVYQNILFTAEDMTPTELGSYWSDQFDRNLRVLFWRLPPILMEPKTDNFDFEIHLDVSNEFDTSELQVITRADLVDEESQYQEGEFIKGVTVDIGDHVDENDLVAIWHIPPGNPSNRQIIKVPSADVASHLAHGDELVDLEEETVAEGRIWYWKVKIIYPFESDPEFTGGNPATPVPLESNFTEVQTFTLEKDYVDEIATFLMDILPDENVYNKEILYIDKEERDTVTWSIMSIYAEEFARSVIESGRIKNNNYLEELRENAVYDNFGVFFALQKTSAQQWVEYREMIRAFVRAALNGSTFLAIKESLRVLTGANPKIRSLKTDPGWLLDFDILVKATDDPDDPDYIDNIPSPTILFINDEYAWGVVITIMNPFNITLDEAFIRDVILSFIPAHVKIYIRYLSDLQAIFDFGRFDFGRFDDSLFS